MKKSNNHNKSYLKVLKKISLIPIVSLLFGTFLIMCIIDVSVKYEEEYQGKIVDKHSFFKPTKRDPGVKNYFMIKYENGKVISVKSDSDLYYRKKIGDSVYFKVKKGYISNDVYEYIILK